MAIALRNYMPDSPFATGVHALLRPSLVINVGIYMVETESRDKTELSGSAGLHGSISTMGIDGLQPYLTWECA